MSGFLFCTIRESTSLQSAEYISFQCLSNKTQNSKPSNGWAYVVSVIKDIAKSWLRRQR